MIKDKTAVSFDGSNEQIAKLRVKCVSSADTNMWFTYTQGILSRHGVRSGFWPLWPNTSYRLSVRSPLILCSVYFAFIHGITVYCSIKEPFPWLTLDRHLIVYVTPSILRQRLICIQLTLHRHLGHQSVEICPLSVNQVSFDMFSKCQSKYR